MVVELKLTKPKEFSTEEKVNFLMGLVLGDDKTKGIVQVIDGLWKTDAKGNPELIQEGMRQSHDKLMVTMYGGKQMIGDGTKDNYVTHEGAVDKIQQLITAQNNILNQIQTQEKMVMIIARLAGLDPKVIVEELMKDFNNQASMWNDEFKIYLEEEIEKKNKQLKKIDLLKNKQVKKKMGIK